MKKSRILPGLILASTFFGCSLNLNTEEQLPEDRNEKLKCSSLDSFPCSTDDIPASLAESYQLLLGLKDLPADSVSAKAFLETLDSTNILRIGNNISSLCPLPSEVMLRTRHYKVKGFFINSDSLKIESLDGDLIFSTWNESTTCTDGCSGSDELQHTICNPEPTVRLEHFKTWGYIHGDQDSVKLTVGDWQASCNFVIPNSYTCFLSNRKNQVVDTLATINPLKTLVLCDTLKVGHCASKIKTELDSALASITGRAWSYMFQTRLYIFQDSLFLRTLDPIFRKLSSLDSVQDLSFYCGLPDTLWQIRNGNPYGDDFEYQDFAGNTKLHISAKYIGSSSLSCQIDTLWNFSRMSTDISLIYPQQISLYFNSQQFAFSASAETIVYNW